MDQADVEEWQMPVWLGLILHCIGALMTIFMVLAAVTGDWDTAFYDACIAIPWLFYVAGK